MYNLIFSIIGTALSFAVTHYMVPGFEIENTLSAYLITSVIFLLVNFFVSPILKLILLPINILTLGLFRWVTSLLVLYLFDLLYQGISITPTDYSFFVTLLFSSLCLSLTYTIFSFLFKRK